jgi:hypothetical protein
VIGQGGIAASRSAMTEAQDRPDRASNHIHDADLSPARGDARPPASSDRHIHGADLSSAREDPTSPE